MRQARIYYKGEQAGMLSQLEDGSFVFRYTDPWRSDGTKPAISLTLPKSQQEFRVAHLFPFFYNMLPEGTNRQVVCTSMRIDPEDYFGILMTTARYDTVGAVTVQKMEDV
ncbi:HipA N-terminal domain-containing protein [Allomuricauda taeanensis]|uniref:HipA N-terminal domain-containing protein n=1 Tax=Flagellimonas taeanensis TaxID=1005926 RepID=UPI002E7AE0AD|nr:HipA N-terminal domain-containing protein [Allomuricauda taeanensis]MEE1964330.1 HipA N-terminal domain-containing protein [Allomuricauda taeanensis]